MSQKVLLKKSSVLGKIPLATDLSYGELALNYADGKLYFKDSTNTIKSFSSSLSINDLTDVDTVSTAPIVGDVLKWNGTNWAPAVDSTAGGAGTDADTLDGFDSTYFLNYNNLSNKPTIPTATSQLTNDSGYITSATLTGYATETYVDTGLSSKQNTLVSGTNIKTINGESLLGSGNIAISGSGATTLDELSDVDLTTPATNGQALVYNSTSGQWRAQDVTGSLYTNTANTTGTTPNQVVDSFSISEYRTVKYIIQASSETEVHTSEVTLMHNDITVFKTEYNVMYSGASALMTTSASISDGVVSLTVTPAVSNLTVDVTRIGLVSRVIGIPLPEDLQTQTYPEIDLQTQTYPAKDLNI